MKKIYPFIPVLLINSIPVIGVLCFGWNVYRLICIFWIESLLIGVFNLAEMLIAQKPSGDSALMKVVSKVGLMAFFCLHYFFFLLIVGSFVFIMLIDKHQLGFTGADYRLIILMLMGGCMAGFITDYILPKKYLSTAPSDLIVAPYKRVVILLALIFAAGFISHHGLGNQYFFLIILVLAKLFADIASIRLFKGFNYTAGKVRE